MSSYHRRGSVRGGGGGGEIRGCSVHPSVAQLFFQQHRTVYGSEGLGGLQQTAPFIAGSANECGVCEVDGVAESNWLSAHGGQQGVQRCPSWENRKRKLSLKLRRRVRMYVFVCVCMYVLSVCA